MIDVEKLKQKILDLAIRGKLVPQDPNDEPASVLINKIKAEKAKLVKEGKIKPTKEESYIYKGSDNFYYEKRGSLITKIQEKSVYDIPDNWIWVRLGTIFDIGSSKRVHKSDWRKKGIPFYRARDVEPLNEGRFKSELYIEESFYNECKAKYGVPHIGDILVTAVGTLGKTYIVKDNNPFYYKDGNIICLSNFGFVNPFYIELLFQTDFMYKQIHDDSGGTTVDTYTIIHANNTLIPLPPLNEQNRIVSFWQKCVEKIKTITESMEKLDQYAKLAKQSVLESIFGCNSSHKSYYGSRTFTTLNKLIPSDKIGDGDWVLSENMDENGEYRIVQLKHIGKGCYVNKPYKCINKNFFENNSCSEIKRNFLLINRLVSDEMDACLLPSFSYKTITSVDVCWIAPDEKYDQKYLMYYLLSPAFQSQVLLKSSGSTRKRISKKNLISIPIQIHNLDDQKMIVKDIEQYFELLNSII